MSHATMMRRMVPHPRARAAMHSSHSAARASTMHVHSSHLFLRFLYWLPGTFVSYPIGKTEYRSKTEK